jgi:hypothetical protein
MNHTHRPTRPKIWIDVDFPGDVCVILDQLARHTSLPNPMRGGRLILHVADYQQLKTEARTKGVSLNQLLIEYIREAKEIFDREGAL